jgi:hypothetical protein
VGLEGQPLHLSEAIMAACFRSPADRILIMAAKTSTNAQPQAKQAKRKGNMLSLADFMVPAVRNADPRPSASRQEMRGGKGRRYP